MAFFGLTQLGQQNYFKANSRTHGINLKLFGPEDMKSAFRKAAGQRNAKTFRPETSLPVERLDIFLDKLYAGPLKSETDLEVMLEFLGNPEEGTILSEEQVVDACIKAREMTIENLETCHYTAAEYDSNKEFRDKGKRLSYDPSAKFVNPVTSSQDYGWNEDTDFARLDRMITKRHPKTASDETRFADKMAAESF